MNKKRFTQAQKRYFLKFVEEYGRVGTALERTAKFFGMNVYTLKERYRASFLQSAQFRQKVNKLAPHSGRMMGAWKTRNGQPKAKKPVPKVSKTATGVKAVDAYPPDLKRLDLICQWLSHISKQLEGISGRQKPTGK